MELTLLKARGSEGSRGQDWFVLGFVHPNFPHVNHVPTLVPKERRRPGGQALIQQDSPHAASRWRFMVPSTAEAAKESAW